MTANRERRIQRIERIERILIRAPNWVGDLVMATASFRDVRRAFPESRITVLLKPGREGVIDGSPDHDEVLIDAAGNNPFAMERLGSELRRRRFDLALVYPNSFRTAWLAFRGGIRVRVGYRRNLRSPLLTHGVDYERENGKRLPVPMPEYYGKLCARIGIALGSGKPRLHVTARCEKEAAAFRRHLGIGEREPLVGLNPGASFGASKLWAPERFAALADAISERWRLRSIVLVGPGEESIADEICRVARSSPINTSSRIIPLDVLKPIVRDLRLLVTTDTGPRQYAVAFDVPVVCVMGPTDPRFSAANLELSEVVRHDVPCGPCHLKTCPLDHRCMRQITVEEVIERIERLDRRVGVFGEPTAARPGGRHRGGGASEAVVERAVPSAPARID